MRSENLLFIRLGSMIIICALYCSDEPQILSRKKTKAISTRGTVVSRALIFRLFQGHKKIMQY